MIKLRRLENASELKMGMTILSVDFDGNEALEVVDCIDGNDLYTASAYDLDNYGWEGDLDCFSDNYEAVYVVEGGEEK